MRYRTLMGVLLGSLPWFMTAMAEPLPATTQLLASIEPAAEKTATMGTAEQLSADALVGQVLASNAQLQARGLTAAAAEQRVEIAGALDDPTISYGIAPATFGSDLDGRHLLQISQRLPWFGKRSLRRQQASHRAQLADTRTDQSRLALASQTRKLWAQWWYVHRALELNAANQALLADLMPVAEAQYAYGSGRQQDLLQVQTRIQMLNREALGLESQREQLKAVLNSLRGEPANASLAAPVPMHAATDQLNPKNLRQQLLDNNPQLAEMDRALDVASSGISLAQREYYPDVRLYSAYVGTLDPAEKRWQIGAEINIPFARSKRRAAVTAAELERESIQQSLLDTRLQLQAQLDQAFAALAENRATIELYQNQLIQLAEQSLEAARRDYANGVSEFANVIDAEQQLLRVRQDLAQARSLVYQSLAEIHRLSGGGVWPGENAREGRVVQGDVS